MAEDTRLDRFGTLKLETRSVGTAIFLSRKKSVCRRAAVRVLHNFHQNGRRFFMSELIGAFPPFIVFTSNVYFEATNREINGK